MVAKCCSKMPFLQLPELCPQVLDNYLENDLQMFFFFFALLRAIYLVCENKKLSHILYEILDVDNVNKNPPFFCGSVFLREEVVWQKKNFF